MSIPKEVRRYLPQDVIKAVEVFDKNFLTIHDAAKFVDYSTSHLRKLLQTDDDLVKNVIAFRHHRRDFFYKPSLRSVIKEKEKKEAEKLKRLEEKQKRQEEWDRQNEGPGLLELKLMCKQRGIPFSNRNKYELIQALTAYRMKEDEKLNPDFELISPEEAQSVEELLPDFEPPDRLEDVLEL